MRDIIFDADDVLFDWIAGFWYFCEEKLGKELDRRGPTGWCMADWIGTDPETAVEYLKEFNKSEKFGELNPTPGSQEAVNSLAKHYNLHVITSCSSNPVTVERRTDNLMRDFGDVFTSVTCLDLGTPKTTKLAEFPASHWTDDNVANAVMGARLGHNTFIRRVQHNRDQEVNRDCLGMATWFTHWSEIEQALLN